MSSSVLWRASDGLSKNLGQGLGSIHRMLIRFWDGGVVLKIDQSECKLWVNSGVISVEDQVMKLWLKNKFNLKIISKKIWFLTKMKFHFSHLDHFYVAFLSFWSLTTTFCVPQKRESRTGLERLEVELMMTECSFLAELFRWHLNLTELVSRSQNPPHYLSLSLPYASIIHPGFLSTQHLILPKHSC